MIIDMAERTLWITHSNPCESSYFQESLPESARKIESNNIKTAATQKLPPFLYQCYIPILRAKNSALC